MDDPKQLPGVRFVGDLDDPWVVAIAETLSAASKRTHATGDLPESAFVASQVLVIHRQSLTRSDAERLRRFRAASAPAPRVLLCHGPHVRHEDLTRWSDLVDVIVPEATALETVPRHVKAFLGEKHPMFLRRSNGTAPGVAVVSANFALRQTLSDAVESLGYRATAARDFSNVVQPGIVLWDVPWLEARWSFEIASRSKHGPVVALLGFADRALVTEARSQGASACLELPLDLSDLAYTLDRIVRATASFSHVAHEVPPPPLLMRHPAGSPSRSETRIPRN